MKKCNKLMIISFIALFFGLLFIFPSSLKVTSQGTVYGNGVDIEGGSKFTLSGGKISSTRSVDYGGGVAVYDGTFDMNGGTIEGNKTSGGGGGVYVGSSGTFNMNGGTIQNNSAINGGGVYVYIGTFNMTGGTIKNNTASINGADVYISGGIFNYGGGTISGNIYTDKIININKRPSSALNITFSGIKDGTKIIKFASGVSAYESDYKIENLPGGMKLEVQNISGTNYLVVVDVSVVKINVTGQGSVDKTAWAPYDMDSVGMCYIDIANEILTFTEKPFGASVTYPGKVSTITATPDSTGYFDGWFIDGVRVQNGRIYVKSKMQIEARFGKLDSAYELIFNISLGSNIPSDLNDIRNLVDFETTSGKLELKSSSTSKLTYGWKIAKTTSVSSSVKTNFGYGVGDMEIKFKPKFGYYVTTISNSYLTPSYWASGYSFNVTLNAIPYVPNNKVSIGISQNSKLTKDKLIAAFWMYCGFNNIDDPSLRNIEYYKNASVNDLLGYVETQSFSRMAYYADISYYINQLDLFINDDFTIPIRYHNFSNSGEDDYRGYDILKEFRDYAMNRDNYLYSAANEIRSNAGRNYYRDFVGSYYNADTSLFNEYFVVWSSATPAERRKNITMEGVKGVYVGSTNCPVDFQAFCNKIYSYPDMYSSVSELCQGFFDHAGESGCFIVDGSVFSQIPSEDDLEMFDYNALFSYIGFNPPANSVQIESLMNRLFADFGLGSENQSEWNRYLVALDSASPKGNWLDISGNLGPGCMTFMNGLHQQYYPGLVLSHLAVMTTDTSMGYYQTGFIPWESVSPVEMFKKYGIKYAIWNGDMTNVIAGKFSYSTLLQKSKQESDENSKSKKQKDLAIEKVNNGIFYYDNKKFYLSPIKKHAN